MKKKYFFSITLTLLLTSNLFSIDAQEIGTRFKHSDGLYYAVTSLTPQTVTVSNQDTEEPPTGDLVIPSEVVYNEKTYKVTAIQNEAFQYSEGLTSVKILDGGIAKIGDYAFAECSSLTSITLPNTLKEVGKSAFQYCSELTSLTFPDGCTTIGNYAFEECSGLTSITLPNTLISIGESAFNYCGKITSLTIPGSVATIGSGAFANCSNLTSLILTDGITAIGSNAFEACNQLKTLSISGSIKTIGDRAFAGCENLTSVKISDGVNKIGSFAFENCSNLTIITIPKSIITIGEDAFSKCSNLTAINVNFSNPVYSSEQGILFNKAKTNIVRYPLARSGEFIIPKTVNTISKYAFADCTNLTAVVIPSEVTGIGKKAFSDCSSLISITSLINNVKKITLGEIAFDGIDKTQCVLKIPMGKKTEYKETEGWKDFSLMEEIEVVVEDKLRDKIKDAKGIFYIITSLNPRTVEVASQNKIEGELIIPREITHNNNVYKVTSIGENAFWNCKKLTSVTIPSSVRTIKDEAFAQSPALASISIPNSVKTIGGGAFSECTSLTSVVIPNGIKTLEPAVFSDCTNLTSVTIPNSVVSIQFGAFLGCTSLTKITLPDGVNFIGNKAFADCNNLETINIPKSVHSIGNSVFTQCHKLTSIILPENLVSIGNYAFSTCGSLTSITFPNTLKSIGIGAFADCNNLTSITIPNSVESIKEGAFAFCNKLNSINVEADNLAYTSVNGILFNKEKTELLQYPAAKEGKYVIPNGVKTIEMWSFAGCKKLTEMVITEGVTSIEMSAFYACKDLSSVTIPNSIEAIRKDAFYECVNLTSLHSYIQNVEDVIVDGNVFYDINKDKCILKVPVGKIENYKTTEYWNDFNNIIANDNGTGVENHNVLTNPITIAGKNITVSEVLGEQISLYNVSGKLIYNVRSAQVNETIAVPSTGTYILRVGKGATKIIVD